MHTGDKAVLSDAKKRVYDDVSALIASPENPTPLVRLNHIDTGSLTVYLKLEWYNPFGSLKDRIARKMLEEARKAGARSLVEASSGNTGLAVAALANLAGLPVEIAVPARAPEEKKLLLRLLGATLWEAADDLCPLYPYEGARGLARAISLDSKREGKVAYLNQYENELNVLAHYETTGPEVWQQTDGLVDYVVAGLGTTGSLSGNDRYLKERKPGVTVVGVEPSEPEHNLPGLKNISKLDSQYVPTILDRKVIDDIIPVTDDEAYQLTIALAEKEALLVGPSTGAVLAGVLRHAERGAEGVAVGISADNAFKYISFIRKYVQDRGRPQV